MTHGPLAVRRFAPWTVAAILAFSGLVLGPQPVSAECDGPVPPFREYATYASRVVIGDVTAVDLNSPWRDGEGGSSRFTLRVRHVIRGSAGAWMTFRDVPYLPCSDHIFVVHEGDRIALALGITGTSILGEDVNTAAWIRGTPWGDSEQISTAGVYDLFGLVMPDSSTAQSRPQESLPAGAVVVLLAGLVAAVVADRRFRRERA